MNNQQNLLMLAREIYDRAHAPYSHFKVAAALISSTGKVYRGVNVENVAYPEGICAETAAIAAMVAGGDSQIAEIVILADSKNLITPCGGCRQRLKEFATSETLVHLANQDGVQQTLTLGSLLPHSFDGDN